MSRKDDLERSIRESYAIIREYEDIIRTSDRPEEKARARRAIQEQWALVEGYLAEYRPLVGGVLPEEMAQIAAHSGALEEWSRVEQAIAGQEAARGILPDEQLRAVLAVLIERQAAIEARLWGSGAIAQDHSVAAGAGGVAVGRDVYGPVVIADRDAKVTVTVHGRDLRDREKASSYPKLRLYWGTEAGGITEELEVEVSAKGGVARHLHLVLLNEGEAVAIRYQISFKLPSELGQRDAYKVGAQVFPLTPKVGRESDGRPSHNWQLPLTGTGGESMDDFTFRSDGQFDVYPSSPMALAEIIVFLYADQEYSESYKVCYTAFTEQGQAEEGFLVLHLTRSGKN